MLKGSSGDVGDKKQQPQPLQQEATPPPRGPTWARDTFWLWGPAKSVAAGGKQKKTKRKISDGKYRCFFVSINTDILTKNIDNIDMYRYFFP